MPRHNYKFRPAPAWEDGYFIPPAPIPMPKHPDDWDAVDMAQSVLAISRNAVAATTEVTRTEPYVKTQLLGSTLIVPCNPDLIKYIFVKNGENYGLNSIRQAILKPILKNGLITAEGRIWKRGRRALSPLFTPRHTEGFAPAMRDSVVREMPSVFNAVANDPATDGNTTGLNATLDFNLAMARLTYLVLSDTLFSGEIAGETEAVLRDVAKFLGALGKPDPLDIIRAPAFIPRLTKMRGFGAVKRLRRLVTQLSEDRRARLDAGTSVPDDFLTLLLKAEDDDGPLSDAEIEDHLITFIGAGHETTSRAMTWMAYLLSQDTEARSRVEAEIDALDMTLPPKEWDEHLPWTMACFSETMRLYPPAPIISRFAKEADEFGDLDIPKNADIMINLWALHRHSALWSRPNAFDPTRFFEGAEQSIDRFQYLPFGLGHRVCIGQRFAMQEAAILAALLFKNYRFDLSGPDHPWPLMRITVQPQEGLPMTVTRRTEKP